MTHSQGRPAHHLDVGKYPCDKGLIGLGAENGSIQR